MIISRSSALHLTCGFSPRQESQISAEQYVWVDSRGLHQLLMQQGIEVVLQGEADDSMNGKIILARLDGYYEETFHASPDNVSIQWASGEVVTYSKTAIRILALTIPMGVSKLSYTLKMYPKKGSIDQTDRRMYIY